MSDWRQVYRDVYRREMMMNARDMSPQRAQGQRAEAMDTSDDRTRSPSARRRHHSRSRSRSRSRDREVPAPSLSLGCGVRLLGCGGAGG